MWYYVHNQKRSFFYNQMSDKKYYNLYIDVKNKILSGEFSAGTKLPSKRIMSDKTGYSLITVERAYFMLEDEGYITSKERCGYFVCDIKGYIPSNLTTQHNFDFNKNQPEHIAINHLPESDESPAQDFEYSVWFKTIRKVISDNGDKLFVKAPNKGCSILRNAIADYLHRYRGMTAQPNNIIIGSGAEQLYETAAKILGRDKIYGIENPSYDQIRLAYEGMGASVCPLKMGSNGITSQALNNSAFDVLHVTPFHSYPSGVTTSISKRYEYLNWAENTGNYIIEDDFDSEFFIPGHPIESLYSLDHSNSIIYINTFSKSLSPAMRIGYMILPDALLEKYNNLLSNLSCSVPVMDQYILAEFISSGNFERHLNHMRRKMKNKID